MLKVIACLRKQEQRLFKKRIELFSVEKIESTNPPPRLQFHHLYFSKQILQTLGFKTRCETLMKNVQKLIKQTHTAETAQTMQQTSRQPKKLEVVNWNVEKQNYIFLHRMQDEIQKASLKFYQDLSEYSQKYHQNKKLSSIWEILNMFERNILWQLKWSFEPNVNYKITNFHLNTYRKYAQICLNSIINQYPSNYQDYEILQNQLIRPKSLSKKIVQELTQKKLDEAQLIQAKLSGVSEAEKIAKYMAETYASRFTSLFQPSQNLYWENGLSNQQKRFQQTSTKFNGIMFIPTIYTAQVLQRTFDKFQRPERFAQQKQYRYLMGLKYNGKSHSQVFGRILTSYLTNFKILSIPTFQKDTLKQLISVLCSIISRDSWYHLTPQMMQELTNIQKQNNMKTLSYNQQENKKTYQTYSSDVKSIFKQILFTVVQKKEQYKPHLDMFEKQIKQKFQKIKYDLPLFNRLVCLINKINPEVVVIDQFNFFGRILHQAKNIQINQTERLVQAAGKMLLASKLFTQNRDVRMFASINDYPYFKLIKTMNPNSTSSIDLHQQKMISYLFEGAQRSKIVLSFLQLMLRNKNSQTQKIITQDLFFQLLNSKVNMALTLRQCSKLAQFISEKIVFNCKKLSSLIQNTQIPKEKLEQAFTSQIFLQPLQKIEKVVLDFIYQQMSSFCKQAQMKNYQARKFLHNLCDIFSNDNRDIAQIFLPFLNLGQHIKFSNNDINKNMQSDINSEFYNKSKIQTFRSYHTFVRENSDRGRRGHQGYKQLLKKFIVSQRMDQIASILLKKVQLFTKHQVPQFKVEIKNLFDQGQYSNCLRAILKLQNFIGYSLEEEFFKYIKYLSQSKGQYSIQFQYQKLNENSFTTEIIEFEKVVYLEKKVNNSFIQQNNLRNFLQERKRVQLKQPKQLQTLYVVDTIEKNQGVDMYCVFRKQNKINIFGVQIGKNKLNSNGIIQYKNYQKKNQKVIDQFKKKNNFQHIIAQLQPRTKDGIRNIIENNNIEKKHINNFGYSRVTKLLSIKKKQSLRQLNSSQSSSLQVSESQISSLPLNSQQCSSSLYLLQQAAQFCKIKKMEIQLRNLIQSTQKKPQRKNTSP